MKKILNYAVLFLLLTCKPNSFVLKDKENLDNGFKIVSNSDKLVIYNMHKNTIDYDSFTFYFIKKNGEFYLTDSTYSKDSIGDEPILSTVRNYKRYDGTEFSGDSLIIRKEKENFITTIKVIEFLEQRTLEFYYDENYKIYKITLNSIEFE